MQSFQVKQKVTMDGFDGVVEEIEIIQGEACILVRFEDLQNFPLYYSDGTHSANVTGTDMTLLFRFSYLDWYDFTENDEPYFNDDFPLSMEYDEGESFINAGGEEY
jgi:hypothetical protein